MNNLLAICKDLDTLKQIIKDLPEDVENPIAARRAAKITSKLGNRPLDAAIIHESIDDVPAAVLREKLRAVVPDLPVLFLCSEVPENPDFSETLKYPVAGPVFRNALRRIIESSQSDDNPRGWKPFYKHLKLRVSELEESNYYQILGVDRSASHQRIVERFDEVSHRYHPDQFTGIPDEKKRNAIYRLSTTLYKALTEAYQVLGDRELRKRYNRALEDDEIRLDLKAQDLEDNAPKSLAELSSRSRAQKFLKMAQSDLAKNNLSSALQNLRFAENLDPGNERISEKIKDLQKR